jgi:hypothetical protein
MEHGYTFGAACNMEMYALISLCWFCGDSFCPSKGDKNFRIRIKPVSVCPEHIRKQATFMLTY